MSGGRAGAPESRCAPVSTGTAIPTLHRPSGPPGQSVGERCHTVVVVRERFGRSIYQGVVKGNVVVLPEDVKLADGAAVEVRMTGIPTRSPEHSDLERVYRQRLLESGLVTDVKDPTYPLPTLDHAPVEVQGPPLSQTIVEERR